MTRKTFAELELMTNDEIADYLDEGGGFVDAPELSEADLKRNWDAICKKLDLKPEPMKDKIPMDNKEVWGWVLLAMIVFSICVLLGVVVYKIKHS